MAMANITVPIQVNLPDDWIEQIVNRLRNDPESEWVEIVRCKDCKRHNGAFGDFLINEQRYLRKDEVCPLVYWRGKAKGNEFDYQYCIYGERRTDETD